jgi:hypothetical protein
MDLAMPPVPFGSLTASPATALPVRMLYATKEAEALLSVSHAQLYRLIRAGRLDARKIGARTFITAASIVEFLASLPKLERSK